LGIAFAVICSLRTILDNFIEDQIESVEIKLTEVFPNSNILETTIDTNELASIVTELRQTVNDIDTSGDGYLERLIFNAFLNKLTDYVYATENGVNTIAMMGDKNGVVTIKSILYNLKDRTLETIAPYFVFWTNRNTDFIDHLYWNLCRHGSFFEKRRCRA
jgi:hypothetical protein